MKVAMGQMCPKNGDGEENLKKMEEMIREAGEKGADIICFPELSYTGYFVRREVLQQLAQPEDGPFVARICELAARHRIAVIAGYAEREGEELYNTCIFVDREGDLRGKSRKVHLWKSEKKRFAGGCDFPVFDTQWGKIAVIICYDMEFPEPSRIAALKGARILFCPAAWSIPAKNRWLIDLAANSLFNLAFTVGVNFADELCCGSSAAAGPEGQFLAMAGEKEEGVFYAELQLDSLEEARGRIPYFEDVKPEILGILHDTAVENIK